MTATVLPGDALAVLRTLPDEVARCCVTSPPYWGLRDYGAEGQIGLEPTPEEYVARMVEVFREVRRVLADDGTLWLNLGDSYAANRPYQVTPTKWAALEQGTSSTVPPGLKPKDLVGIPWRVAFALQADGWYLRSEIIWAKPNPMPESVTDRPTKAHEQVFLLSKRATYFWDQEGVREESAPENIAHHNRYHAKGSGNAYHNKVNMAVGGNLGLRGNANQATASGRNPRSVWTIATQPFSGAHFAVMPPELARRCILAGSSEKGRCSGCGKVWERVVDLEADQRDPKPYSAAEQKTGLAGGSAANAKPKVRRSEGGSALPSRIRILTGWRPTCPCSAPREPDVILDPFAGAGTTGLVACQLGRSFIGIELNPANVAMAERRIRDGGWIPPEKEAPEGSRQEVMFA